jgi:2-polyprenyl-3-methyl-5-hydroxy-6-metoxy-1,4-benzoquinol methylase
VNLQQRSYKKELLDGAGIPFADIKRNMQELNTINHLLGGHKITLRGVSKLISSSMQKSKPLHIVEVGCGGGDNLRVLKKWLAKKGIASYLTGIDINNECIDFARQQKVNACIEFICSDYRTVSFDQKPNIIFSSLFCHHFTDDELVEMMHWKFNHSTTGFFINHLQRHSLA